MDGATPPFRSFRETWVTRFQELFRHDRNFEIYVMNADGSGQTRLTDNPEFDADPAWSPVP